MEFNKYIEVLGDYFVKFEIVTSYAIVKAKFPKQWLRIIDADIIKAEFNGVAVNIPENSDGTVFFACEISEGIDNVFAAALYVVSENQAIEAKAELLKQKTKELQEIFVSEPIERLRTIRFTFEDMEDSDKTEDADKEQKQSKKKQEKKDPKAEMREVLEQAQKEVTEPAVEEKKPVTGNDKPRDASEAMKFINSII